MNFILDTNVLLHDPEALFAFGDNTIIIPFAVLEELDKFKREQGELGFNARSTIRILDDLRKKDGDFLNGVEIKVKDKVTTIKVLPQLSEDETKKIKEITRALSDLNIDNKILLLMRYLIEVNKKEQYTLVTKDVSMRLKAHALSLSVEDYENDQKDYINFEGYKIFDMSLDEINDDDFLERFMLKNKLTSSKEKYIYLNCVENKKKSILFKRSGQTFDEIKTGFNYYNVLNIIPRNIEQVMAIDALLDEKNSVVTLKSKSGTGKTLLAVACGLKQIIEDDKYDTLIISKPTVPVGEEIGFLPGNINEKMFPWMESIYDAIEVIKYYDINGKKSKIPSGKNGENLQDIIKICPLSYIRGRSFHRSFIIVDEIQNITGKGQIKTLLTRVGESSKIVLTGDIQQIDNIYLDEKSNGLSYLINKFYHCDKKEIDDIWSHITLKECQRSKLADISAEVL